MIKVGVIPLSYFVETILYVSIMSPLTWAPECPNVRN